MEGGKRENRKRELKEKEKKIKIKDTKQCSGCRERPSFGVVQRSELVVASCTEEVLTRHFVIPRIHRPAA